VDESGVRYSRVEDRLDGRGLLLDDYHWVLPSVDIELWSCCDRELSIREIAELRESLSGTNECSGATTTFCRTLNG
jgi:hypothetical protein